MTTFTPQEEKVYAALSKILTNEFDIPAEKIRPEARLYEDFDIDSIDAVDMIVQLKPYLGNRTVKPEAFKAVRTLGDVVSVIAKIMEEPDPAALHTVVSLSHGPAAQGGSARGVWNCSRPLSLLGLVRSLALGTGSGCCWPCRSHFLPRFSDKVAGGLDPLGHRGLSMRSSCILRTGRTHAVISSPCQCLSSLGLRHNASPQSNAHGRTFRPDERFCAAA